MKQKIHICFVVIISLVLNTPIKAQTLQGVVISHFENVELQKAIASVGHLEVDNDMLYLVSKEGTRLGATRIEVGLRISFEKIEDETNDVTTIKGKTLRISFCQSSNMITIQGIDHFTTAHIYSMNGQQQMVIPLESEKAQQVDVSSLNKGIYILQIDTQVFKLLKK